MTLKLATKFDPQPAKFETARLAGFQYAELWLDSQVLASAAAVIQHANDFPFEYVLHFPNRVDLGPAALEQVVALYRALRCRCMVIHQPMYDKFHDALLRREPNLQLAVENHRLTPPRFEAWAQDNAALTLDVEHLWKFTLEDGGLDSLLDHVRGFLVRFGAKLRHVHLPGYWPGRMEHRPMYCSREMIFPVLSLLADFGFAGFVVSEIECEYQNLHEMRMDVLLLEAWREQPGRRIS